MNYTLLCLLFSLPLNAMHTLGSEQTSNNGGSTAVEKPVYILMLFVFSSLWRVREREREKLVKFHDLCASGLKALDPLRLWALV